MRLGQDVDMTALGKCTPGYVGSDLRALVREAGMISVTRIIATKTTQMESQSVIDPLILDAVVEESIATTMTTEEQSIVTVNVEVNPVDSILNNGNEAVPMIEDAIVTADDDMEVTTETAESVAVDSCDDLLREAYLTMEDFLLATKTIQPTAKREGFAVVPDVTWNDVGALSEVREELLHNVLDPIANPERYRSLGLDIPAGVLFFGPPGCGKTLLAKAVANQSGANFISVKGPELLNMYVGESESRVRQVFARARDSAPCVIFFDELDALCPRRGSGFEGGGGNGVSERVVNQLLTELDGLETRKDVYCIAATNRLELIDEAMLRPGRLGKLLYVPLPLADDRVGILTALTRKLNLETAEDSPERVNLTAIGSDPRSDGFSGADMAALVREAGLCVIKEWRNADTDKSSIRSTLSTRLGARHFEAALEIVRPSVSETDRTR